MHNGFERAQYTRAAQYAALLAAKLVARLWITLSHYLAVCDGAG
jgi:hypothetical protein